MLVEIMTYDDLLRAANYFVYMNWISPEQYERINNQVALAKNTQKLSEDFQWKKVVENAKE